MSSLQDFPPTELEIDDITGSDQFPDDLKVYAESWNDYHCRRRIWNGFGGCHWLFWSPKAQFRFSSSDLPLTGIVEKIKSILIDVEGRGDFLVQFWKAIDCVDGTGTTQNILTSRNQPFGLNSTDIALYAFASMSRFHKSDATSEQQHFGLPNQVFRSFRAECTRERRAYPIPLGAAAVDCNITASLAFPLFGLRFSCVGVLEIVTNSDCPTNEIYEIFRDIASKYAKDPFFGSCIHLYEHNDKREKALEEIKKSLLEVRRIHAIPLAQTWIPCKICDALIHIHQVIKTQNSSHLQRIFVWGRIKKGRGAVGKAVLSNKLEYCEDVSGFSITDYPLVDEVRDYGVTACFAVPLRRRSSALNEEDDSYVVEFFLPPNYVEFGDWRTTAHLVLSTMRQHLKYVSAAFGDEVGKDLSIDDILVENGGEAVGLNSPNQEKENLSIDKNLEENGGEAIRLNPPNQAKENLSIDENLVGNRGEIVQQDSPNHRKAATPDLKQHSGMKLENAATSLGVSQSTFQHGQTRNDKHSPPNKSVRNATQQEQIRNTGWSPVPASKQGMPLQVTGIITIKAKYGDAFIKFQIPVGSGMVEFEEQVMKGLNLRSGTYKVRYQDVDNDWILMACDEDLQDCISNSISEGRNTITVFLQPMC